MRVWRDLLGGGRPSPIELPFNNDLAADGSTRAYKGALVKVMDFDDVDNGSFVINALVATAMENVIGILEEDVTSGYLPNDAAYGTPLKKITPVFPSTVILAEYARKDPAGTSITDTGATCTAGSATFTLDSDTADEWIGGWIYMLTGSEAGRLHYITDSTANTSVTFATAATKAIAVGDTFLAIGKPLCREVLLDTYATCLQSTLLYDTHVHRVVGLMHYIEDIGIPFQPLQRNLHDNIMLKNPKFYHAFTIGAGNAWAGGYAAS